MGIHIIGMSAVTIVIPKDVMRTHPYTRIDFLGPILRKTAFDIMLENVHPVVRTSYRYTVLGSQSGYLKVAASKREAILQEFPVYLERNMDVLVRDFLSGSKAVPSVDLGFREDGFMLADWRSGLEEETGKREVIYRSEPPYIIRGLYGDKETFRIKVTVLVGREGNVKNAEALTTTGYPQVDIMAVKYVKGWIFEPREGMVAKGGEWQDIELHLTVGD